MMALMKAQSDNYGKMFKAAGIVLNI